MFNVGEKVRIHLLEKDSIFHDRTGTVIESLPNIELYKIMFDSPPRNKSATPVASNWFDEKNIRLLDRPV